MPQTPLIENFYRLIVQQHSITPVDRIDILPQMQFILQLH
uniref:Ferritinic-like n=1 Tax=Rhizophora mucronata TaxID=61149 RepID=A0A2P2JI06_RHIMU